MTHQSSSVRSNRNYLLLAGLILGFGSCSHEPNPNAEGTSSQKTQEAQGEAVTHKQNWLQAAIIYAKTIENGELPSVKPGDEVNYFYEGRRYHYANLQAFRVDIKRGIDSLKAIGVTSKYDTVIKRPMVSGKLQSIN